MPLKVHNAPTKAPLKPPAKVAAPADDYGTHLQTNEATAHVTIQSKPPNPKVDAAYEEKVSKSVATSTKAASVTVGMARTINTGNFENVKLSVYLSMPCDPADIDLAFDGAVSWVDNKLDGLINQVTGA